MSDRIFPKCDKKSASFRAALWLVGVRLYCTSIHRCLYDNRSFPLCLRKLYQAPRNQINTIFITTRDILGGKASPLLKDTEIRYMDARTKIKQWQYPSLLIILIEGSIWLLFMHTAPHPSSPPYIRYSMKASMGYLPSTSPMKAATSLASGRSALFWLRHFL